MRVKGDDGDQRRRRYLHRRRDRRGLRRPPRHLRRPTSRTRPICRRCSAGPTQRRRLEVWANGDYPHDAERAREFGAQGIGLCRTEHMFFQQDRLPIVQGMILAEDDAARQARPGPPAPRPDGGLPRHPARHERPAGGHPPDRPAAARVPALAGRPAGRGRPSCACAATIPTELARKEEPAGAGRGDARAEPHAGPARHPPGHHLPGDRRDAGASHRHGDVRAGERGGRRPAGDHGAAGRPRQRDAPRARAVRDRRAARSRRSTAPTSTSRSAR